MRVRLNELSWDKIGVFLILVGMATLLYYGIFTWPDAPIKECGIGYCGKYGNIHSVGDYLA
jgi:hypothetical protein